MTAPDDTNRPPRLPNHVKRPAEELAEEIDELTGTAQHVLLEGFIEILAAGAVTDDRPQNPEDQRAESGNYRL